MLKFDLFNSTVTLKIRARSTKPNQVFIMPQCYSNVNLFPIHPLVHVIPARSHTFVEIDHEIISMVILLPSAESFKKGCQLQAKVCAGSTG